MHNVSSCALASRATVCQGSTLLQFCYKIKRKPNQSTWYQPWAVTHLSPLCGHPIPTLFTDPPVTIWPSPKAAYPFGNYLHPRPNLVHVHVTSALTETGPSTLKLIHYHGRQGKYVWQIIRQSTMKIGWWDAPLTLRDSAGAIHMILTMGGSPFCFHGGSLAVRFLL